MPPGEAPDWVRQQWVGLELPLAPGSAGPVTMGIVGVLSGASPWRVLAAYVRALVGQNRARVYPVDVEAAIAALERTSPSAAAWWRENTPHLFKPGQCLLFAEEACQVVPGEPAQ